MKTILPNLINTRLQPGDQAPRQNGNGFNRFHSCAMRRLLSGLYALMSAAAILLAIQAGAETNYVAHEWGTFTSIQGGDGKLLWWHSLRVSELPGFVYNWVKAGMNRGRLVGFKGELITRQRMETPVIYFYADQQVNVNVDVAFPKGFITEWYPQAEQIGPTYAVDRAGPTNGILHESRAVWRNVEILPKPKHWWWLQEQPPQDSSGSHYFAARETAANLVRVPGSWTSESETEKFIFYRGAGDFETPLRVTVDSNNVVTVENTGPQNLSHLFLVNIHGNRGAFGVLDELGASNSVTWLQLTNGPAEHWSQYPLPQFQTEIGAWMETCLRSEGLYPDEAKAMVNTWKDSWFTEPGVRVLYILPRAWTDETLPLTLTPQPKELTRVMLGRAEIITPEAQANLSRLLVNAAAGDSDARAQADAELKTLGRFAEPALNLASNGGSLTNVMSIGYQLLYPTRSTFNHLIQ